MFSCPQKLKYKHIKNTSTFIHTYAIFNTNMYALHTFASAITIERIQKLTHSQLHIHIYNKYTQVFAHMVTCINFLSHKHVSTRMAIKHTLTHFNRHNRRR